MLKLTGKLARYKPEIDLENLRVNQNFRIVLAELEEMLDNRKYDYHELVPRELDENLDFRLKVITDGYDDKEFSQDIWLMCKRDFLFFINVFVWTFNPKLESEIEGIERPKKIPFITYAFQDHAILKTLPAIGKIDIHWDKSRDMGASWLVVVVFTWLWLFYNDQALLMVSRDESLVEKTGNPKTLFWKVDYVLEMLPSWLGPIKDVEYTDIHLSMTNKLTNSSLDGESTKGDTARGDRRTALLLDESAKISNGEAVLSSTRDVTNTRWFASTPHGTNNMHYWMKKRTDNIIHVSMHWSLHPDKSKGIYVDEKGKLRSEWYDFQCSRTTSSREIAEELDIDYHASDAQFFNSDEIEIVKQRYAMPAYHECRLNYDELSGVPDTMVDAPTIIDVDKIRDGELKLWINLDIFNSPPRDRTYVIGVDISQGTGASNSTFSVGDKKTGEKVCEYASPYIRPEKFAVLVAAVGYWFTGGSDEPAKIIPEYNGPGVTFTMALRNLNYPNIYRREDMQSKKRSKKYGFFSNKETKENLLTDYRKALNHGTFINRSEIALSETMDYVFTAKGIEHSGSYNKEDESGASLNHGDRVIADALCCKGIGDIGKRKRERINNIQNGEAHPNSFRFRQKKRQDMKKKQTGYWDDCGHKETHWS